MRTPLGIAEPVKSRVLDLGKYFIRHPWTDDFHKCRASGQFPNNVANFTQIKSFGRRVFWCAKAVAPPFADNHERPDGDNRAFDTPRRHMSRHGHSTSGIGKWAVKDEQGAHSPRALGMQESPGGRVDFASRAKLGVTIARAGITGRVGVTA